MKNKKGNANAWLMTGMFVILLVAVIGGGYYLFAVAPTTESGVGGQTIQQITEAGVAGDAATIKVYVRNLANNDINTKVAVATYCVDDSGDFVIDGTSSSTTAEISGSTTRGKIVTCYAFNSTYQTLTPKVVTVDEEIEHVVIDAYNVPTISAKIQVYNDQLTTGTGGVVNVTGVGADSTGSMQKIRITNNNTDTIYPLGGLYLNTITSSNVSTIDLSGGAQLSLRGSSFLPAQSSATFAESDKATSVSARKDNWDFVFDVIVGEKNQLLLEENDYIETGAVRVTGDGDGCVAGAGGDDLISMYTLSTGYFRGTKSQEVLFGHETDASSSAVITADITGETFYCVS